MVGEDAYKYTLVGEGVIVDKLLSLAAKEGTSTIGGVKYGGGNHLPDIVIAAPAFVGDKLVGWIANIAHHSDIGGKVPGSTSGDADSLFQEGIRIPVIRIREITRQSAAFLISSLTIPVFHRNVRET